MSHPNSLDVGDILAVLFSRSELDTFHWTICVPMSSKVAAKYHAKNSGDFWWFEDPVPLHSILTSSTVAAAIKIGTMDPTYASKDVLRQYLSPISMSTPAVDQEKEPRFTCRVWFREAIRILHQAGILTCTDVDALEEECVEHAKANQAALPTWGGYMHFVSQYSV
ncbi:hypothetical protein GGX14DRAFT_363864 [Mycena pura]|uniref:Uncharacterized protein n=1 Tax=Mycena pura TaxID=153505 RepID=A0AAD6VHE3_9AGAR|nr:hypothetical protein GGX14DRAFT_363864 [Mycena pura]